MDLNKKQLELQHSSAKLLEERIAELKNGQQGEMASAKVLVKYTKNLANEIKNFQIQMLQQVISKVIKNYEEYYKKQLNIQYKNCEDFLAQPLTLALEEHSPTKALKLLKDSKKDFQNRDEKILEKEFEIILSFTKELIKIGGEQYDYLQNSKDKQVFKEMPQRVALALWDINAKEIAYVVMTHIVTLLSLDNADGDNTSTARQTVADKIGEALHHKIAWRFLSEYDSTNTKTLIQAYKNENFDDIDILSDSLWSEGTEIEVGSKLMDIALDCRIIEEQNKIGDEQGFKHLQINEKILEQMKDSEKNLAYMASMIFKPMVVKPLDWKDLYGGGFLDDNMSDDRFDISLIKASTKPDRKALKNKKIPKDVLDAVNHLQKSSFRINTQMLEVLLDYHKDIKFLTKKNRVDFAYYRILREMVRLDTTTLSNIEDIYGHFFKLFKKKKLSESDKKRIRKAHKEILKHQENIDSFRLLVDIYYEITKYKQGFDTIVNIAKEMQQYKQFYFVWQMDFRGRLYPVQSLINPQAGDLPKSLLLFSEEKSLTSEGERWFKIHGANSYGEVDKRPFNERILWVEGNERLIVSSAKNYRDETFWKKASDPFKFLAFCFEYVRYLENPQTFKTSIPIAIDGSNNGFQHITALLKDSDGAKMVNVLPYKKDGKLEVADFYESVSTELKDMMKTNYNSFESNKDSFIYEDGLYFKESEQLEFVPEYHLPGIIKFLEELDIADLKSQQNFSTFIDEHFSEIDFGIKIDKKVMKKFIEKEERKVRKLVGKEDIEELKYSLIDTLEIIYKRAIRDEKKDKIVIEKSKAYRKKIKLEIVVESVYDMLLTNKLINRQFVKKPVMTESYGSTTMGKKNAILELLEGSGYIKDVDEAHRDSIALGITKLLEKSLSKVSKSPQIYKKWMKNYAKEIAKKESIYWLTPLGLEVKQVEYKSVDYKVNLSQGRDIKFSVFTNEIDRREHEKGFAPNFIHSLDASHLMISINALQKKGISDIVTVHDSFATHANDVSTMSKILRESFVMLHKSDILNDLAEYIENEFDIEKKDVPYVNSSFTFDAVLQSEYFFC